MLERTLKLISTSEQLAEAIYTYTHYNELAEQAEKSGAVMKEAKDFYADRILNALDKSFKDKSREEVRAAVQKLLID